MTKTLQRHEKLVFLKSLVGRWREKVYSEKKETKGGEKIDILKLEYCVTLKLIRPVAQLFMVDVLPNGVHEHVTIC